MNRSIRVPGIALPALLMTLTLAGADPRTIEPDLADLVAGRGGWQVRDCAVTLVEDAGRKAVRFGEDDKRCVAWLEGIDFTNGVIEVDIKGRDVHQKSFVGVMFRGVDRETFDSVYFRPFNFRSDDPLRRVHHVQYISLPEWNWQPLREQRTGIYESSIHPIPDPDGWFRVRVVVDKPKVSVYVNGATEPSLVVEELTERTGGWVGLFTGIESGGSFANLKITPR